jgi:hypothetical protein
MAYNFQTGSNKIKLLTEYENVTQKVWKKYDVIPQNDDFQEKTMCVLWFFKTKPVIKTQRCCRTQYGKAAPSDNAIRRRLKQFQGTGSVLHRKGAGRPSTSQEDVDRIQETCSRSPQKSELLCL